MFREAWKCKRHRNQLMQPLIGLLLIVVGICLLFVSLSNGETQGPQAGDQRVVERRGSFYVQTYYKYPDWHDAGGKFSSAAEAHERLRELSKPFETIVDGDNAPNQEVK